MFFKKIKKILSYISQFLKNLVFNKKQKAKENFADNQIHNILRLFDVLPNFPSTTSETMGDYYL